MCKHVAAVLYGVGARLDQQPEVLFRLRAVNEKELIASAGKSLPSAKKSPAAAKVLAEEDLSKLFGLEIAESESQAKAVRAKSAVVTKSKPVDSKTKPPQKNVNSKVTLKSATPTKTIVKKRPIATSISDVAQQPEVAAVRRRQPGHTQRHYAERDPHGPGKTKRGHQGQTTDRRH
jgi:uncharacterized Zn finger protein